MIDLSHPITEAMMVYPGDPEVSVHPALTLPEDGSAVARLGMGTHTGTHVDAPAHVIPGGRSIDQISLNELSGEALILRPTAPVPGGRPMTASLLGLEDLDSVPEIVVVHTGWDRYFGTAQYLRHPYLEIEAVHRLLKLGMRVLGLDTLSPDPTTPPSNASQQGVAEPNGSALAVHHAVLGADGLIVENLRGLDRLLSAEQRRAAEQFRSREQEQLRRTEQLGGSGQFSGPEQVPTLVDLDATGRHRNPEASDGAAPLAFYARLGVFPLPLSGVDAAPARVVAYLSEWQGERATL